MKTKQQLFMTLSLEALERAQGLKIDDKIDDMKTLCQNTSAWLVQSGLAASMDAVARYQHKNISQWLQETYLRVLRELSYSPSSALRAWCLSRSSVENLRVTQDLIDFTHCLTRVVRLKEKGLL